MGNEMAELVAVIPGPNGRAEIYELRSEDYRIRTSYEVKFNQQSYAYAAIGEAYSEACVMTGRGFRTVGLSVDE
jgi:hypothetical protein